MYRASYRWWNWKPPAGFRFAWTDAVAIAVCALATWGTWPILGDMAVLIPVVLGHFFLFCNVFRVPRLLELLWSGTFVVSVGVWSCIGQYSWTAILWTQLPITLMVILAAIVRSDYHGVGCRWLPWVKREGSHDERLPSDSCPTDR